MKTKDHGGRWVSKNTDKTWAAMLSHKGYWGFYFVVVVAICVGGIGYFGGVAHFAIPPLCDYVGPDGKVIISEKMINDGEEIFHYRGLMQYGTFLGDGAERGPDFTAESLHIMGVSMAKYYKDHSDVKSQHDLDAIEARVRTELRNNTYDKDRNVIVMNEAMQYAWKDVALHYRRYYSETGYSDLWPIEHIKDTKQVEDLSAFFFWGGWMAVAARPGEKYSYTHNWPYDPLVGNLPTPETMLWSAVSVFVLFVGIGAVLYVYSQFEEDEDLDLKPLTTQDLENDVVRPTQRACYKFFVLSMLAFAIQVFAGVFCSIDFVRPGGFSLCQFIPFSVLRSYHGTFQIFWFFVAWVGTTIFFLPRFHAKEPAGQSFLIEMLFVGCFIVAVGGTVGIPLGQTGYLQGEMAYYFGSQGWEFMELGRLFQDLLLVGFVLWIIILFRGVSPYITWKTVWSAPAWLFYGSMVMVWFLFFSLKVTPKTNFIVSDFWRWMVVHMWVEVTFEVFTTVIVGFLYSELGLVSRKAAERATYIAVMLFFLTATIGVGHNFYWIAKPTGVIALGSTFATTQVLPLILLTMDAYKYMQMRERAEENIKEGKQKIIMKEVWLFLLGVNFWNVCGAGMLGSLLNLPIVNYFEHSTYLTGNHAHSAMFGVKGNVALAGLLFCAQHVIKKEAWSPKLVKVAFWGMNGGMGLMMMLNLFPTGVYQFMHCVRYGLWSARSPELVQGKVFQILAKGRAIGGHVFVSGGLLPMVYFICSRMNSLRPTTKDAQTKKQYRSFWLDLAGVDKVKAQ